MMSVTEKESKNDPNHYFLDDYEPLDTIIRDPYG